MVPVSVVIITKNEAALIEDCIKMARLITDDIVVVDNDSTDGTPLIASGYGCRVFQRNWAGYGANKNKGIALARYNWILSIDADEVPDADLIKALHNLNFDKANVVYDIKFKSYLGKKLIRFGNWGSDH
ncbi:MAG TPA: glycosyltransferase family 2 protein, partial [Mucilaginibacter sp.]